MGRKSKHERAKIGPGKALSTTEIDRKSQIRKNAEVISFLTYPARS